MFKPKKCAPKGAHSNYIIYSCRLENCHNCTYESKDGIELRKSSVDKGIGHNAVALALTNDTIGADLTLTDSREKAYETDCKTDTEKLRTHNGEVRLEDNEPKEESYEAVKTLCCRKSRENHISR